MKKLRATPSNLTQAIANGVEDYGAQLISSSLAAGIAEETKADVVDFLAQKFSAAALKVGSDEEQARLETLWENITGKKWGK